MSLLDSLTKSLINTYTKDLDRQQQAELIQALEVIANDQKYNKFKNMFPSVGEYRKELYPRHMEFFEAGSKYRERGFIAGNRTGKTEAGCYEAVCHATGLYPDDWKGKRFATPTLGWVGGDTATTCRDIIQKKLLGEPNDQGSGMIPKDLIHDTKARRNVPEAVETIYVKHISGGVSTIVIKTYEQGRATWQGTEVDWIWIDEECPQDVYGEALIRTMTTGGIVFLTFTPLNGLTDLVLSFLQNDQFSDSEFPKYVCKVGWNDVPHLDERSKAEMLAATPPQLRDARSKGDPTVGSGRIYPLPLEAVTVADFQIPKFWRKLYGFDVGWKATAACWGAWDENNDIIYVYSEYLREGTEGSDMPLIHSEAIKSRGRWMNGVIDHAARGRSEFDGANLFDTYKKHGLNVRNANKAVDSGIYAVWERLSTGRLKIFKSCTALQREFGLYHRDDKGKIVKTNDHLLDALRYLVMAEQSAWKYPEADRQSSNRVIDISAYMNAAV